MAVAFAVMIMLMARFTPGLVFDLKRQAQLAAELSTARLLTTTEMLAKLVPIAALVALVLGGLYSGFFTPTEAGGVGAFGAFVIAILRRKLGGGGLWRVLTETGAVSVGILILLVAAGFAPLFQSRPLDDPQMARVLAAVRLMLANHEPYPALAVDRAWNLRMANTPYERLEGLLGAGVWDRIGGAQRNLLRLFFHPAGIRPRVANWPVLAPLLWQRARREAAAVGGQDMQELLSELAPHQDPETLRSREEVPLWPLVPLELELEGLRLSLFSIISTFGTAQDVTADELRIECLFPADGVTERLFRRNAPGAATSPQESSPRTAR